MNSTFAANEQKQLLVINKAKRLLACLLVNRCLLFSDLALSKFFCHALICNSVHVGFVFSGHSCVGAESLRGGAGFRHPWPGEEAVSEAAAAATAARQG